MRRVLFLCVGNSCRSQMAEGFARAMAEDNIEATSAGTRPADRVASLAVEVMREKGIDISGQHPKLLTREMIENSDILISMGCGVAESLDSTHLTPATELDVEDSCPVGLLDKFSDWGIEDPWSQPIEKYREVRDDIEKHVKKLLEKLEI